MLDIKYIRENKEIVKEAAKNKLINVDIDRLLVVDQDIRNLTQEIDKLKNERNKLSSSIPNLSDDKKKNTINYVKDLKEKISALEEKLNPLKEEYKNLMYEVPGVPLEEVPIGKTDEDNVEIKRVGEIPKFNFKIKDHVELAEDLDLIDIPRGVKISGSRSYFLKNEALLLEMALCRYVVDKLVKKGFTPMGVPVLVKEDAMYGTSYFPGGREQTYTMNDDNLYLVGTSEVALVSYHSGETFDSPECLPKMYCGYSNCFRREAGTYGKDTHGLYRVHQFTKSNKLFFVKLILTNNTNFIISYLITLKK